MNFEQCEFDIIVAFVQCCFSRSELNVIENDVNEGERIFSVRKFLRLANN